MSDLALHQLTLLDTDPLTLIDIAAEVGCTGICIFAHIPDIISAPTRLPTVPRTILPEMKTRMSDKNITVDKIDVFAVTETPSFDSYRDGFEIGATLGARHAITLVYDTLAARAAENLAKLGEIAAEYDLNLAIEFMTLVPGCTTIQQAAALIRAAGRDNIRISVDALHLERSGGTPADVAAIDPSYIVSAQLCDGPLGFSNDYLTETAIDRQVAGEGEFPLTALVAALPAWTDYDVETPLARLQASGISPLERARRAVSGARAVLAAASADR